ncbi:MAG: Zn-dependent hydrolase [Bacteroidota bacterium]
MKRILWIMICLVSLSACQQNTSNSTENSSENAYVADRLGIYESVRLTTDLSQLSENEKQMISLLIPAAKIMDQLFQEEALPTEIADKLATMALSEDERAFMKINYGPWDRLAANKPFIDGVGEKPLGANFYPSDMTKEEFEAFDDPSKTSLYTLLRRDDTGKLMTLPYHKAYSEQIWKVADILNANVAVLAEQESLKKYLKLRAQALLSDDYKASDIAWMEMQDNGIDVIIGPIETYEDQLFGYKAAHESYILVKDKSWTKRLERYASFLPDLQKGLPVPDAYKQETPGRNSQLGAYDVVYYAGDCNAGSKTIAVNLPNDEEVQLSHGTRRLQLKNAMRAKFDKILVPLSGLLIAEDQRKHITFDAFFGNTMFHEVAHGLGIKETINGKGKVRESLKELASALEEGKADVLGLYMVTQLFEKGEIPEGELMDNYVTFVASIFRSIRFGASSAHGKANMVRFNHFMKEGAITRDAETGTYRVDFDGMQKAMASLSEKILTLQGDGDYDGVKKLTDEMGLVGAELQADLDRLGDAGIPVDIVFEQGLSVLGL